ncbi:hypothetical protein SDC9_34757 [bioreactor metagenome]|uniref:Uncharacterized protein n=1 Tax=bioreactor metagenome TaxID=1076179 RepID=A0A644VBS0_9ZZZZ
MRRDDRGKAFHRDRVTGIDLADLEIHPARAAGDDEGLRLGLLDLGHLHPIARALERVGAFDQEVAGPAAAAEVVGAVAFGLVQLPADRLQDGARLLEDAAPAADLARVVQRDDARFLVLLEFQPTVHHRLAEIFGHGHHVELDRLAERLGRAPAQRREGVAAFGHDHHLGADLDRGIGQFGGHLLLRALVAREKAEVRPLVGIRAQGVINAHVMQRLDRAAGRILEQVDVEPGGDQQHVGLRLVDRDLEAELFLQRIHAEAEQILVGAEDGAVGLLPFLHEAQLVRHQPRRSQRRAVQRHHVGDVDPRRTDQVAPPAHRAGIIDQLLLRAQIVGGDVLHDEFLQPAQRRYLAVIDPLHQVELVHRRIFRVLRAKVELAGLGTGAAMHAGVELGGEIRVDALQEDPLRRRDALLVGHVDRGAGQVLQARGHAVEHGEGFVELLLGDDFGHAWTPLRQNFTPRI